MTRRVAGVEQQGPRGLRYSPSVETLPRVGGGRSAAGIRRFNDYRAVAGEGGLPRPLRYSLPARSDPGAAVLLR